MNKKVKWIAETAVLLALLVVLQAVTKAGGQYLTGSCVNLILGIAALVAGLWSGVTVAVLSPFFAFLLGIGPQNLAIIPAISLGNLVLVVVLHLLARRAQGPIWKRGLAVVAAAGAKALVLYLVVVQLLCTLLSLPEQQVGLFTAMFSWPQAVTALIGGTLAMLLAPVIRKGLKHD